MHTIHKTEVLTILRSIVARLEANVSPDSDWSKEPCAVIEHSFNGLNFRLLFWRGDVLQDELAKAAERRETVSALCNEVRQYRERIAQLETQAKAEANRASVLLVEVEAATEVMRDIDLRFGCGHAEHGTDDWRNIVRHIDELIADRDRCRTERDHFKAEIHRLNLLLSPPATTPRAIIVDRRPMPDWLPDAVLHAQIADALGVSLEAVREGKCSDDMKTITIAGKTYTAPAKTSSSRSPAPGSPRHSKPTATISPGPFPTPSDASRNPSQKTKSVELYQIIAAGSHRIKELEQELDLIRSATAKDAEDDSIVASCNCCTKSPDIKFHKPGCKYRLIIERDMALKGSEDAICAIAKDNAALRAERDALKTELEHYRQGEKPTS